MKRSSLLALALMAMAAHSQPEWFASGSNITLRDNADNPAEIVIEASLNGEQNRSNIQNAMNSFATNVSPATRGGIVRLMPGDYPLSQAPGQNHCLFVPAGVTLKGSGRGPTNLRPQSNITGAVNVVSLESNANVEALQITNGLAGVRIAGQVGILAVSQGNLIKDVEIRQLDIGIDFQRWSSTAENCNIVLCNTGIQIVNPTGDANNISVQRCQIQSSAACGIRIRGINNQIIGNDISVLLQDWNGTPNSFRSTGIQIQAGFGISNSNLIMGNHMEGNAVHVEIGSGANKVIGNFFEKPAAWSTEYNFLNGADNVSSGNQVSGNSSLNNYAPVGWKYEDYLFPQKMGIGTNSPTAVVDINPGPISNSNPNIRLRGITTTVPTGGNDGDVQIYQSGTTRRLYIKVGGTWRYSILN